MALASLIPAVPVTWLADVPFGMADGTPLLLDILCPAPIPTTLLPTVIWIQGNACWKGHRRDDLTLCYCFAQRGFFTLTIDYRLSPQAPFPAQLHDVKAAIRWVRANASTYTIDPERIGLVGYSAGGHLAALAGVTGDLPELEGN